MEECKNGRESRGEGHSIRSVSRGARTRIGKCSPFAGSLTPNPPPSPTIKSNHLGGPHTLAPTFHHAHWTPPSIIIVINGGPCFRKQNQQCPRVHDANHIH